MTLEHPGVPQKNGRIQTQVTQLNGRSKTVTPEGECRGPPAYANMVFPVELMF
jgi:hypothetical protein